MDKFQFKINNLAIQSENQSASGTSFIAESEKKLQDKLGTIFGIIELFGMPDDFVDGFHEIINDLKTEYYLPPFDIEYGIEKRFEECLQRANRRVHKLITRSVERIELRDINVLMGLMQHDKVYLSQIGKNNAFLFHQKKDGGITIVDIFGQAGEKKSKLDPEKMFSNIISGKISTMDELFFCNDSILEFLSQMQLSETILDNDLFSAINQLERELQPHSTNNNFYCVIVEPMAVATTTEPVIRPAQRPHTGSDELHPQTSLNRLITTQEKTEQYLTPSLMPNWKKVLIIILIWLRKLAKSAWRYALIGLKMAGHYIGLYSRKLFEKITKKQHPSASPTSSDAILTATETISISSNGDEQTQEETIIITEEVDQSTVATQHIPHHHLPPLQRVSQFLNKNIAYFLNLSPWQKFLWIVAFIFIFIFSESIVWKGQAGSQTVAFDVQTIVAQATEAINNAEAQNVFNNEDGASASLQQAQNLFNQIPNKNKYKDVRNELQGKIDELIKTLQKVSYITDPEVIADLNNKNSQAHTQGLAKVNNTVFTFDNQSQTLYTIDISKKQTLSTPLALGNIKRIEALNDKNIILMNDKNEFYQYEISSTSTKKVLTVNNPVNDFNVYSGKIYTLQASKNQIFKHLPAGNGFNSGSGWIRGSANLSNNNSLTISNTGIYMTTNNGSINHFSDGKSVAAQFAAVTPPLQSPTQIDTDADSNFIYVLDPTNQRVVVYDKSGNVKIQYSSKQFTGISDMVVNPNEKKIYLLSSNKVYSIATNF